MSDTSGDTSGDRFIELFPLSVYRDRLDLETSQRQGLAQRILADEQRKPTPVDQETAWLGDTAGHEFLFDTPEFAGLFEKIGAAVKDYAAGIGLQPDNLNFYFQRSWATVSRQGQRIFEHAHLQSHISFAYYLQKSRDAGGIYFSVAEHPNELAEGLFTIQKSSAGILAQGGNKRSLNRRYLEPNEDEIIIFPSKTLHSTAPNMTTEPRISISADIVITLKDSGGHETLMPPVERWKQF